MRRALSAKYTKSSDRSALARRPAARSTSSPSLASATEWRRATHRNRWSAGSYHSCGVRTGGSVKCWGFDLYGQIGAPGGTFPSVSSGLALYLRPARGQHHRLLGQE